MKTLLLVIAAALAPAQSFEVASVKIAPPVDGDRININLGSLKNGTLTLSNTSLADCLRYAYTMSSDAQIAGESWIKAKDVRYVIVAKAAPETTRDQAAKMLQGLLAERFKIESHWEPREMSYYAIEKSKNGAPKLQPANGDPVVYPDNGLMHIIQPHLSMQMLGTLLSRFELRAPVIDETGIAGNFAVKLEWQPANARADAPAGPSIFTAVKEQLGLQLEAKKGPVPVLVIDHAQKIPQDN